MIPSSVVVPFRAFPRWEPVVDRAFIGQEIQDNWQYLIPYGKVDQYYMREFKKLPDTETGRSLDGSTGVWVKVFNCRRYLDGQMLVTQQDIRCGFFRRKQGDTNMPAIATHDHNDEANTAPTKPAPTVPDWVLAVSGEAVDEDWQTLSTNAKHIKNAAIEKGRTLAKDPKDTREGAWIPVDPATKGQLVGDKEAQQGYFRHPRTKTVEVAAPAPARPAIQRAQGEDGNGDHMIDEGGPAPTESLGPTAPASDVTLKMCPVCKTEVAKLFTLPFSQGCGRCAEICVRISAEQRTRQYELAEKGHLGSELPANFRIALRDISKAVVAADAAQFDLARKRIEVIMTELVKEVQEALFGLAGS